MPGEYLEIDYSGTGTACMSETIGSERLVDATDWLHQRGFRAMDAIATGGSASPMSTLEVASVGVH